MRCTPLLILFAAGVASVALAAPQVDHHQHLLGPDMSAPGQKPIDGAALIAMLDEAGIRRAVLLSNAFHYGNPGAPAVADEYARVRAENDWTAGEAAKYSRRLVALCSFNPLADYALPELERCARDPRFGRGIKLQFAVADVSLDNPAQVATVERVFRAADAHRLAIVVHMRTRRARPYGAAQARVFLEQLLAVAPHVPVQIAHFTGGGNPNDTAADEALAVFIDAIRRHDPRVKHLYFDTALIVAAADTPQRKQWVAQRIRDIGLKHVLYGSDGGDPTDPPPELQVQAFHSLPLTAAEFKAIESNVAPYLRSH